MKSKWIQSIAVIVVCFVVSEAMYWKYAPQPIEAGYTRVIGSKVFARNRIVVESIQSNSVGRANNMCTAKDANGTPLLYFLAPALKSGSGIYSSTYFPGKVIFNEGLQIQCEDPTPVDVKLEVFDEATGQTLALKPPSSAQ